MTEGAASDAPFQSYIDRWWLTPEGQPVLTRTSRLLPVRSRSVAAMLKIAVEAEEELGNELMVWGRWCLHEKAKPSFWGVPRIQ
jgi:streptomycin 6-kinase